MEEAFPDHFFKTRCSPTDKGCFADSSYAFTARSLLKCLCPDLWPTEAFEP